MKKNKYAKLLCICFVMFLVQMFIMSSVTSVYAAEDIMIEETKNDIESTNHLSETEELENVENTDLGGEEELLEIPSEEITSDDDINIPDETEQLEEVGSTESSVDVVVDNIEEIDDILTDGEEIVEETEEITVKNNYFLTIETISLVSSVYYSDSVPTIFYKISKLEDGIATEYFYKTIVMEKEYAQLMSDHEGYISVPLYLELEEGIYRIESEKSGMYYLTTEAVDVELFADTNVQFECCKSEYNGFQGISYEYKNTDALTLGAFLTPKYTVYCANEEIKPADFEFVLVKDDGTTEEISLSGFKFDFYDGVNEYKNMLTYPNIDGAVVVDVSYFENDMEFSGETMISLYKPPYVTQIEKELKAGHEDNGKEENYIVTEVYSDGTRSVILPEVKKAEPIRISSKEINGIFSHEFPSAVCLSIRFAEGSKTNGVEEILKINDIEMYDVLNDINVAGDHIEIEWNGSAEWSMTITPVYANEECE